MIQSPLGILSLSGLQLSNIDNHIKDLNLEKNVLRLEIEANGNYAYSDNAVRVPQSAPISTGQLPNPGESSRNGYCLWPGDGNADTFFKEGRAFYFKNEATGAEELNYYTWKLPAMFNAFIARATDYISILLVLETADMEKSTAMGSSERPASLRAPKKQVIGRAKLPIAELSLFMEKQIAGKVSTLAVEMDFLSPTEAGVNITELPVLKKPDYLTEDEPNKKQVSEKSSHYNLLSDKYHGKLILTMELYFNTDVVKEAKEFATLKHNRNQFSMPEVVEHKDYINTGFDAMMRKQKKAKQQQKLQKTQGQIPGMARPRPSNTHLMAEISLEALDSFLHKLVESSNYFGFFTVEPLYKISKAHIPDYL